VRPEYTLAKINHGVWWEWEGGDGEVMPFARGPSYRHCPLLLVCPAAAPSKLGPSLSTTGPSLSPTVPLGPGATVPAVAMQPAVVLADLTRQLANPALSRTDQAAIRQKMAAVQVGTSPATRATLTVVCIPGIESVGSSSGRAATSACILAILTVRAPTLSPVRRTSTRRL